MAAQPASTNLPNTPTETSVPATTAPEVPDTRRIRTTTMDSELAPWPLYDLSAAVQPDTPDTIRDHFRRFRATQEGYRGRWTRGLAAIVVCLHPAVEPDDS
ncbi:hypothetical protein PHMEG_00022227 [Phytophthora megakarya]|uniref:Uncharacterized protein n=1 Tax=Phytophthora megakarya TaxID=4795 RepID=A0A225VJC3_9STRA|nr:hypothetical protein PHMEG_00022227 [Phytophthora megakarya]